MKRLQRYELFRYFVNTIKAQITMGKEKNNKKRLTKVELAEKITGFFQTQPDNTFSLKQIFRALKLHLTPKDRCKKVFL